MADSLVRACLITNPRSGRGGIDLSEALPVLQAQGWEVVVRQKLHGGHATELAQQAVREGYHVVVDCGGDGTLSEIVDGVVGTGIAVGVLPGGTANVWAAELGVSRRLRVAAMQLAGAQRHWVDVGRVTVNGRHGQHFLLMAGLGLDGAVMARVSKPLKNRIGTLAVGVAAVQALPAARSVPVRVEVDGVHWQGRVTQIVVGNTRRYGGFARITGGALIDDGLLDICLITAWGPGGAARQLASLVMRGSPDAASAETYRGATIVIHAPVILPLQVDGGAVRLKKEVPTADGMTYAFSLVARGACVLVPSTYNGELFAAAPTPLAAHPAEATEPAGRVKKDHAAKEEKRLLTVTAVGVDSFTAVRAYDGRAVTVGVDHNTGIMDAKGATLSPRDVLPTLVVGQLLRVKSDKDAQSGTLLARRITLLPPASTPDQE